MWQLHGNEFIDYIPDLYTTIHEGRNAVSFRNCFRGDCEGINGLVGTSNYETFDLLLQHFIWHENFNSWN